MLVWDLLYESSVYFKTQEQMMDVLLLANRALVDIVALNYSLLKLILEQI